jgi:hypothetical protein
MIVSGAYYDRLAALSYIGVLKQTIGFILTGACSLMEHGRALHSYEILYSIFL